MPGTCLLLCVPKRGKSSPRPVDSGVLRRTIAVIGAEPCNLGRKRSNCAVDHRFAAAVHRHRCGAPRCLKPGVRSSTLRLALPGSGARRGRNVMESATGNVDAGGRIVPAGNGWQWIADGWTLFMKQPGVWILIAVIVLVAFVVL